MDERCLQYDFYSQGYVDIFSDQRKLENKLIPQACRWIHVDLRGGILQSFPSFAPVFPRFLVKSAL